MRAQFFSIDNDGNGFIEASEVHAILKRLHGDEADATQVEQMLLFLDTNKDGIISFAEFISAYAQREFKAVPMESNVVSAVSAEFVALLYEGAGLLPSRVGGGREYHATTFGSQKSNLKLSGKHFLMKEASHCIMLMKAKICYLHKKKKIYI